MSENNAGRASWNPDSMIENARSLQRVAKELNENGHEAAQSDEWLFRGMILAGPILLSLATEIALKAWLCMEQKKAPPRTHDLLELFELLKQDTQEMLEARMRKVSRHSVCAEQPGMQNLKPYLQDMFAARMHPHRDVLCEHRNANVHWRYLYEKEPFAKFETGEIDCALTVIFDAYYKSWRS